MKKYIFLLVVNLIALDFFTQNVSYLKDTISDLDLSITVDSNEVVYSSINKDNFDQVSIQLVSDNLNLRTYWKGNPVGKWQLYVNNFKRILSFEIVNDSTESNSFFSVCIALFFDNDSELVVYEFGSGKSVKYKVETFDEQNNLINVQFWNNNYAEGEWLFYNKKGQLLRYKFEEPVILYDLSDIAELNNLFLNQSLLELYIEE